VNTATAVTAYITDKYLPGVGPAELDADYDLLANGVIDSLGLLKLIAWLQDEFAMEIDDREISPEAFRSVSAIRSFIESR
jgi:acyl carrier protein